MIFKKITLFVFSILVWQSSFSQGIRDSVFQLQEVIKTADKLFKKEEAGMTQTRVDSMVLIEKSNLSLSELLSENTPVFIKSHGRGALATASFRGTAASHTQVNWNGININSPMTGMVDFSLLPVYVIDQISLKHGASSIADQSGGLGGTINIENKADWSKPFRLKYMQGIGSFKTFDEFFQISFGKKKWQIKTRLYHNYSKNNYIFVNRGIIQIDEQGKKTNPLDTNENADFKKIGILQEFYFRPTFHNTLSLKYWGQVAKRSIPQATSYEGPDNANLNRQNDADHKLVADWKHFADKYTFSVRSAYIYKKLIYTLKNQVPGVGLIPAIYSQSSIKSSLNVINYKYIIDKNWIIKGSLNGDYHWVNTQDTIKKTGYTKNRLYVSGFVSTHKNFADKLNLTLMLRQDFVDHKFNPLVPFFGFDYQPFSKYEWVLKGNVARNYHQPNLNDLYWQPGGNPNLKSEDGISYELGVEYQNNIVKKHLLKSELTAYYTDIDNWIIWIPSFKGYWEPRNIKRVVAKGVEIKASLSGNFGKVSYQMSALYAYSSSINYGEKMVWGDASYGKQLVYVPLHSGNVFFYVAFKGFFLNYQHNSYSERFTTSSNDVSRRDWLYPYFMNNLTVGKKIDCKKFNFSAKFKIYNLFNETYHSILYRPMPKINYMLLLTLNI